MNCCTPASSRSSPIGNCASKVTRRGVTVTMGRREHNVDADRIQIVNLLMSSLDNARHRYDKVSAQNLSSR